MVEFVKYVFSKVLVILAGITLGFFMPVLYELPIYAVVALAIFSYLILSGICGAPYCNNPLLNFIFEWITPFAAGLIIGNFVLCFFAGLTAIYPNALGGMKPLLGLQ